MTGIGYISKIWDTDLIIMEYLTFLDCWNIGLTTKNFFCNKIIQKILHEKIKVILSHLEVHCNYNEKNKKCRLSYAIPKIKTDPTYIRQYKDSKIEYLIFSACNKCDYQRKTSSTVLFHSIIFSKTNDTFKYKLSLLRRLFDLFMSQYEKLLGYATKGSRIGGKKTFLLILERCGFIEFFSAIKSAYRRQSNKKRKNPFDDTNKNKK